MIVCDESSSSANKARAVVVAEEVSDDDRGDDDDAFIVVDVCNNIALSHLTLRTTLRAALKTGIKFDRVPFNLIVLSTRINLYTAISTSTTVDTP